jgi:hypothetical protein
VGAVVTTKVNCVPLTIEAIVHWPLALPQVPPAAPDTLICCPAANPVVDATVAVTVVVAFVAAVMVCVPVTPASERRVLATA